MLRGSITSYIDVAQLTLYAFFIFFAGIVLYLRREDKREGYPLEADMGPPVRKEGFPFLPKPKIFRLTHGGTVAAPGGTRDTRVIKARRVQQWYGSPLQPTGDPMIDGVGPASYALREEKPELMLDGTPLIRPMRVAPETSVDREDADPRGMTVVGADNKAAGIVTDLWVDIAEPQIRYLEVEVTDGGRHVLLPMPFARVSGAKRQVKVNSILARHFATVPGTESTEQVTKREEDQISAYYASGHLYATPSRLGPLL